MGSGINLGDLPEEMQRELYGELKAKFDKPKRDSGQVTKQGKIKAMADVLKALNGFTIAQQRAVLVFTVSILENAQHRFWRDGHEKAGK